MKKTAMLCMLLPLISYAMDSDTELDNAAVHAFLSEMNLQCVLEDTTLTPHNKMQRVEEGLKEFTGEIDTPVYAVTNAFGCVLHDHCVKTIAQEINDDSARAAFIEEHMATTGHYMQQ